MKAFLCEDERLHFRADPRRYVQTPEMFNERLAHERETVSLFWGF